MKKNLYLGIFLFQAIIISISSCVSQKQIVYFQKTANQSDTINIANAYTPKIQPGDILSITIGSLNPLASSFFNPYSSTPVTSDNSSGNPLSPYAVTKYVNELYAGIFSKTYDFHTIGPRYFNVFGPRQNPNGAYAAVIPSFIACALKNKVPNINGDGETSRNLHL